MRKRGGVRLAGFAVAMCIATPSVASAQLVPTRDAVLALAGDGAHGHLRALRDSARRSPTKGPLQFRYGMLAWAVAEHDAPPNGHALRSDGDSPGRLALDALRLAVVGSPDSARYRLALNRLSAAAGVLVPEFKLRAAVRAAAGDSILLAEALLDHGRYFWHRYDDLANRALPFVTVPRSVASAMTPIGSDAADALEGISALTMNDASRLIGNAPASLVGMITGQRGDLGALPVSAALRDAWGQLREMMMELPPGESGEGAYLRAEELFREACAMSPGNAAMFRNLAMLLVERSRWDELAG